MPTNHWNAIKSAPTLVKENRKELTFIRYFWGQSRDFRNISFNNKEWDFIITDLLLDKLDAATRKRFELQLNNTEIPKYDDLKEFLLKQCNALETILVTVGTSTSTTTLSKSNSKGSNSTRKYHAQSTSSFPKSLLTKTSSISSDSISVSVSCVNCGEGHDIVRCPSFIKLSLHDRFQLSKQKRLCINCLKTAQIVPHCQSKFVCRKCQMKHHTLLHFDTTSKRSNSAKATQVLLLKTNSRAFNRALVISQEMVGVVSQHHVGS